MIQKTKLEYLRFIDGTEFIAETEDLPYLPTNQKCGDLRQPYTVIVRPIWSKGPISSTWTRDSGQPDMDPFISHLSNIPERKAIQRTTTTRGLPEGYRYADLVAEPKETN